MARPKSISGIIAPTVSAFITELTAIIENHARAQARDAVLAAIGARSGGRRAARGTSGVARRAPKPATPAQKKARLLQGRYMGTMRGLPKADQAKVKAARVKDGVEAAIALAEKLKK